MADSSGAMRGGMWRGRKEWGDSRKLHGIPIFRLSNLVRQWRVRKW